MDAGGIVKYVLYYGADNRNVPRFVTLGCRANEGLHPVLRQSARDEIYYCQGNIWNIFLRNPGTPAV